MSQRPFGSGVSLGSLLFAFLNIFSHYMYNVQTGTMQMDIPQILQMSWSSIVKLNIIKHLMIHIERPLSCRMLRIETPRLAPEPDKDNEQTMEHVKTETME